MSLTERILAISFKYKLSHMGSCLSCVNIIKDIYANKHEHDLFILSNGHAGLALYVVLEEKYGIDAEALYLKHGIHPGRDEENKIYCSTGSLGSGIAIATGYALAEPLRDVYCMISDGECAEGVVWESLNFKAKQKLSNLKIHVNCNGWSAYDPVDIDLLERRLHAFCPDVIVHRTSSDVLPFLHGLDAHYYTMTHQDAVDTNVLTRE